MGVLTRDLARFNTKVSIRFGTKSQIVEYVSNHALWGPFFDLFFAQVLVYFSSIPMCLTYFWNIYFSLSYRFYWFHRKWAPVVLKWTIFWCSFFGLFSTIFIQLTLQPPNFNIVILVLKFDNLGQDKTKIKISPKRCNEWKIRKKMMKNHIIFFHKEISYFLVLRHAKNLI